MFHHMVDSCTKIPNWGVKRLSARTGMKLHWLGNMHFDFLTILTKNNEWLTSADLTFMTNSTSKNT